MRSAPPGPPMKLGNMRSLGVRSLAVTCELCHHEAVLPADRWPDFSYCLGLAVTVKKLMHPRVLRLELSLAHSNFGQSRAKGTY